MDTSINSTESAQLRSAERGVPTHPYFKTIANLLLLGLALWVLAQNVYLTRTVRTYRRTEALKAFVTPGTRMTNLMGLDPTGKVRMVDLRSGPPKLLITFRPDCPTCIAHVDRWLTISENLHRKGWPVVWISASNLQDTVPFLKRHGMDDQETVINPDHLSAESLKLDTVPQILALDDHGIVLKSWAGVQPWTEADIVKVVVKNKG